MPTTIDPDTLRLAIPKGRMHEGVVALLHDAGIKLGRSSRGYRPTVSMDGVEAKILKPQNIVEMLASGTRDAGFAGADWVAEMNADLVEVLDLNLDPVRLVVAAPRETLIDGKLPDRSPWDGGTLRIAGEYPRIIPDWIERTRSGARFVRTFGATEVFPPEDADAIVDVAASGATLEANGLAIAEVVMTSSTRLYASRAAWEHPAKRATLDRLVLLLSSVLEARSRVMLELNTGADTFEQIVELLPCMRRPTVAQLLGEAGYAVKAAVPRSVLPELIPQLKDAGATDLVVAEIQQVVL